MTFFGDSTPLIAMDEDKYIVVPNTAEFTDARSTLTYHNDKEDDTSNIIATIHYTYSDVPVGDCDIIFTKSETPAFNFAPEMQGAIMLDSENKPEKSGDTATDDSAETNNKQKVIFINVKTLVIGILVLAGIAVLITAALSIINSYSFTPRGQSNRRRRQRKHESRVATQCQMQARRTHAQQDAKCIRTSLMETPITSSVSICCGYPRPLPPPLVSWFLPHRFDYPQICAALFSS